ncbi:hypothetical protein GDO86_012489 [Hymenochirus boettgeri]|uniref:Leukocyte receptor cluster member 9 n=1 Tax=Hymenochirus boettgeri TaxID=247094 RepID=A0A8T2IRD1_9PIPI|nr:hypothetical protein GDO86_012489 [Hymenochirus boettgeri]
MARCRFGEKCRNTHTELFQGNKPKIKSKIQKEASEHKGKKPPMKTAADVISRIQWDTKLPKECFLIGYLDRFLGVIEKPFSDFCWEDLASVGHDVLAIPKHRIQYFKYLHVVVWDKSSRIDNVFGSTGSGLTILDIIDQYKSMVVTEPEKSDNKASPEETGHLLTETNVCCSNEDSEYPDEDYAKAKRPTHFVAVRVNSDEVRSTVEEIQGLLQENNPEIAEFFMPIPTLHLTLCLLCLESSEDIQTAILTLQELKCEFERILPPSIILNFEGLQDFHSRVLYLAPSSIPALEKFEHMLNKCFQEKGLKVMQYPGSNTFHVTIAKIPTKVLRQRPNLAFCTNVYQNSQIKYFGAQPIDSLSLCYAGKTRRTDGFYTTLLELSLY